VGYKTNYQHHTSPTYCTYTKGYLKSTEKLYFKTSNIARA